jgi:hypothetical protein
LRPRSHFRRYRGCQVPFSRFALPDLFSAVPLASAPVFITAPELIFGGIDGVKSCFLVLRSHTRFRQCGRASDPIFKFYAPVQLLGRTEGVDSRFHVLRYRTRFWQYQGRKLSFSCFARPNSFSAVPTWVPFSCLRSQTLFRWCVGRRVPLLCFALSDTFLAVRRASGPIIVFCTPIFLFCVPALIFGGTEGIGSRFHVFRSRTHFRRYRGRRVPFLCFVRPD